MNATMLQNKIAGYRRIIGKTQRDMANIFQISVQAYSNKETGKSAFKDSEKVIFRNLVRQVLPLITIDEIFFD